jgi:beta-N-acetylhexosaminidase
MTADLGELRLSRRRALMVAAGGVALAAGRGAIAQARDPASLVAAMSPRERAARMFMISISGTALGAEDERILRDLKPGGVILVGGNFGAPEEVRALVAAIHATDPELPPLVALDQEGGIVSRIGDDPAPDAATMGQLPSDEISALARARAETLAGYGFDVNFAPVADVAFAPDSFLTGRAFGADPTEVAEDVRAYLGGVIETGVLHCVKHFPGHGRVSVDSHEALPALDVDTTRWWEEDALPFRVAVEHGVPMVMLGHLVMPQWGPLPASLSPEAVRVLREEMWFPGVVVSDDLGMGALAAWEPLGVLDLAVAAGNDLLLYVILPDMPEAFVDHLMARIERGELAPERVAGSVERILAMQFGLGR